jgi:hypothetical protein
MMASAGKKPHFADGGEVDKPLPAPEPHRERKLPPDSDLGRKREPEPGYDMGGKVDDMVDGKRHPLTRPDMSAEELAILKRALEDY